MGFKLPGKSIQSGTSAHSSALKMVAEQKAASALKATDWASIHEKAKAKDARYGKLSLEEYTAEAKRQSASYKKTGKWDAMGVYDKEGKKKGTKKVATKPTKMEKVEKKAEDKVTKIESKAKTKVAEVGENKEKKVAKLSKKEARKKYGRGSKEHLEAKKTHLEKKEADRQGEQGGRKQTIFRKISSKINKKKQKKNQEKLDKMEK